MNILFCSKLIGRRYFRLNTDAQEEAEITILEVSYLGGFVKYDLHTKDGNVDVVRSYYKYENGNMKREFRLNTLYVSSNGCTRNAVCSSAPLNVRTYNSSENLTAEIKLT